MILCSTLSKLWLLLATNLAEEFPPFKGPLQPLYGPLLMFVKTISASAQPAGLIVLYSNR